MLYTQYCGPQIYTIHSTVDLRYIQYTVLWTSDIYTQYCGPQIYTIHSTVDLRYIYTGTVDLRYTPIYTVHSTVDLR